MDTQYPSIATRLSTGECSMSGPAPGSWALLLAERGHQVTAIDFSEPMLTIAARKADTACLPIAFQLGDAYEPPLQGQVFDAVVCRHVAHISP